MALLVFGSASLGEHQGGAEVMLLRCLLEVAVVWKV